MMVCSHPRSPHPNAHRPLAPLQTWVSWAVGRGARGTLEDVFLLYFVAIDSEVPVAHRLGPAAAIVYIVAPCDAIPDVIPLVGVSDDIALLGLTIRNLGQCAT